MARPRTYYHVAPDTYRIGTTLESLHAIHGDAAYDMYAKRWPDAGTLGFIHAHYVHLHATLADAQAYVEDFGGIILSVTLDEDIKVIIDQDEYPHPMVEDSIPANMITPL